MPAVNFALGLEPKEAIAFLKGKKALLDHLDEKGLLESARAKATRIANITSLEMTKDIYQSLIIAQEQGQSFGEWKKGIFEHFKRKVGLRAMTKAIYWLIQKQVSFLAHQDGLKPFTAPICRRLTRHSVISKCGIMQIVALIGNTVPSMMTALAPATVQ